MPRDASFSLSEGLAWNQPETLGLTMFQRIKRYFAVITLSFLQITSHSYYFLVLAEFFYLRFSTVRYLCSHFQPFFVKLEIDVFFANGDCFCAAEEKEFQIRGGR